MKSSRVKAITFDVGGTLIQPWPSVGHVYSEVAAAHGHSILPLALNQRFARAWRSVENFDHTREQWAALVDETFLGLTDIPPSKTFFNELYDRFGKSKSWQIFKDTVPTLERLASQGVDLGIISNWDERLRPLLAKLDLEKYFKVILVSCEVGFAKPSPVIFQQASKHFGLAPESILHIGDSAECDVAGAKTSGLQALLLERNAASSAGQIQSLDELPVMFEL